MKVDQVTFSLTDVILQTFIFYLVLLQNFLYSKAVQKFTAFLLTFYNTDSLHKGYTCINVFL